MSRLKLNILLLLSVSIIFPLNAQNDKDTYEQLRSPFRFQQRTMEQVKNFTHFNFPDHQNYSYSDKYQNIVNAINIDSLSHYVRQLSGEAPIWTDSGWDTIMSRYSRSPDILKAQNFLQRKLRQFGYETELQQFSLEQNFGDIAFAPDDANFGWFYLNGKIYHTSDAGQSWNVQYEFFTDRGIRVFEPVSKDVVYAVGYDGLCLKTTDGGINWISLTTSVSSSLYGASFFDANQGWICGNQSTVLHTKNGGKTWESQTLPTSFGIYSIYFTDSQTGWAVGPNGTILKTADGGKNWEIQATGVIQTFLKVYFSNAEKGFILGTNGALLFTNNGGEEWNELPMDTERILWDIHFCSPKTGILVGDYGTLFTSQDSGKTWQACDNLHGKNIYSTHMTNDSTVWVTGRGIFSISNNFGTDWTHYAEDYIEFYLNNISAEKTGILHPDTYFILCAHYDSYAEAEYRMTRAPGADDNASGTATVLEAARILSDYEFNYTIKFALFSAEELGLIGSRYYADRARDNGDQIPGVINLDMVGFDSNLDGIFDIHSRDIESSQMLGELVRDHVSQYDLSLNPNYIPNEGTTRSDHASFWENGYSAILLIESFDDFNSDYHSILDLFGNIDQSYFLDLSRLAIISIARFAELKDCTGVDVAKDNAIPESFHLSNPYPNPFNSNTQISLYLPEKEDVKISVHNMTGQLVEIIEEGELNSGTHQFRWNVSNASSGVYLIRVQTNAQTTIKKCLYLK